MILQSAAHSHAGLRRRRNEDAMLLRPDKRLYAVADGMGGHAAGNVASRMAVEVLDAEFPKALSARVGSETVGRRLMAAAAAANEAICARGLAEPDKRGMGTTLTALVPVPSEAVCVIAHIGDSRAYRLRRGSLVQLTTDHTWVQEQVELGTMTPEQARRHPLSSVLTRVLGVPDAGDADLRVVDVERGDLFLLCSDGLSGMVDDASLQAILSLDRTLEQRTQDLIEAANGNGGYDNITALLLHAAGS